MARRKGISKTKTSAKKLIAETTHSISTEDSGSRIKDDSGDRDDKSAAPLIDIVQTNSSSSSIHNNNNEIDERHNRRDEEVLKTHHFHNQHQSTRELPKFVNNNTNSSATFDDLKYLHKKFKRLASTTLNDTNLENNGLVNNSNLIVNNSSNNNNISPPLSTFTSTSQSPPSDALTIPTTTASTTTLISPPNIQHNQHQNFQYSEPVNYNQDQLMNSTSNSSSSPKYNGHLENPYIHNSTSSNHHNELRYNEHNTGQHTIIKQHIGQTAANNVIYVSLRPSNAVQNLSSSQTPSILSQQIDYIKQEQPPSFDAITTSGMGMIDSYIHQNHYQPHHLTNGILTHGNPSASSTTLISAPKQSSAISTSVPPEAVATTTPSTTNGRHVCPYCQMNCSKPSVLQKHIRAHTNERPYPCGPCGCAFKTKSNLYKHQRSRTHTLRTQGGEPPDDDVSQGSDQEQDQEQQYHQLDGLSQQQNSTMQVEMTFPSQQLNQQPLQNHQVHHQQPAQEKPYKPKFHNAYKPYGDQGNSNSSSCGASAKDEMKQPNHISTTSIHSSGNSAATMKPNSNIVSTPPKNLDFALHITKLISDNEAIVEGGKPPLPKKTLKSFRGVIPENSSPKLALALLQKELNANAAGHTTINKLNVSTSRTQGIHSGYNTNYSSNPGTSNQAANNTGSNSSQPLNLTKIVNDNEATRKRCFSESFTGQDVANHPQNPERSIIKDLLLNSKGFGAVADSEAAESLYNCPFCKISFRNAETLKYHTICYCQGNQANSPQSASASPAASPSHQYLRAHSNSASYNPNSLAKLASTSLRQHPYRTPTKLSNLAKVNIKQTRPRLENIVINTVSEKQEEILNRNVDIVQAPLPSPGPLLGKTRLVDSYYKTSNLIEENTDDVSVYVVQANQECSSSPMEVPSHNFALPTMISEETVMSQRRNSSNVNNFQMFGGEVQVIEKKNDLFPTYGAGGSVTSLSPSDSEPSPLLVRSGLFSGGSLQLPQTPKEKINRTPLTPKLLGTPSLVSGSVTHFQFPPINSISGYNPLTLPPITISSMSLPCSTHDVSTPPSNQPSAIIHGGKIIPFVPGIPGPNTNSSSNLLQHSLNNIRVISPNRLKNVPSPLTYTHASNNSMHSGSSVLRINTGLPGTNMPNNVLPRTIPHIKIYDGTTIISDDSKINKKPQVSGNKNGLLVTTDKNLIWSPAKQEIQSSASHSTRKFNFARMAENLSPRKINAALPPGRSPDAEIRHFNYENLIAKSAILIKPPPPPPSPATYHHEPIRNSPVTPIHVDVDPSPPRSPQPPVKNKFLRPTSLPLKPGTFIQKKHHGITPTQNTMPLISPETPRPSKNCIQLYLNGHAYTYLGLKCSTKLTYCTLNRAQPVYIANQHKLSMYSEWRVQTDYDPHPLGLKQDKAMSLYDSRHRPLTYSVAKDTNRLASHNTYLVHSQSTIMTPFESAMPTLKDGQFPHHQVMQIEVPPTPPPVLAQIESSNMYGTSTGPISSSISSSVVGTIPGGYESNEDYTYVRGRGRGRYVCSECGIRCKKPSMLKKHIRTHTDVRPYTCKMCSFSFKTKGNLTKHMKSKTHYKKCIELGLNPIPMPGMGMDDDSNEMIDDQMSMTGSGRTSTIPEDSDTDSDSDGDDVESESSDTDESKSRLLEQEAAHCLISLSMTPPISSISTTNAYSQPSIDTIENRQRCIITTFSSAKPNDFNLLKHDQYYSNPNVNKVYSVERNVPPEVVQSDVLSPVTDDLMPIDLTKPKERETPAIYSNPHSLIHQATVQIRPTISEVIEPIDQTRFITSLVSIMDKIPTSTTNIDNSNILPNHIDENKLLHQYLTERALQDSKMKQSQMIKKLNIVESCETTNTNSSEGVIGGNGIIILSQPSTPLASTPTNSEFFSVTYDEKTTGSCENDCEKQSNHSENEKEPVNASSMETLAEIAASSVKLDVSNNLKFLNINDNAKTVASEYLKLASNETRRQAKISVNEDEEFNNSESDQDDLSNKMSNTNLVRKVVVGEDGFKNPVVENTQIPYTPRLPEDGRAVCKVCSKTFQKEYHLLLHYNIHYIERKFRCEPCASSFRTKGHLQKHERGVQHNTKVSMTSTFGVATTSNPRPFKCGDCEVAFRIHGHLAKHLRSKSHVMKLECIGKLPFGMYAEIERAGVSLTDIDTTNCDNSLTSLLLLAQKLHDKDPNIFGNWTPDANNISILQQQQHQQHQQQQQQHHNSNKNSYSNNDTDSDDSDNQIDEQKDEINSLSRNMNSTSRNVGGGGGLINNISNSNSILSGGNGGGGGDSAFSSDSSTGSIKRKIDQITGSLDPLLIGSDEQGSSPSSSSLNIDHKRLKTLSDI